MARTKVEYKRAQKETIVIDGKSTELFIYMAEGDKLVAFHLHPTQAFVFVPVRAENVDGKEFRRIAGAFVEAGLRQHDMGGFDNAVATLLV